MEEKREDFTRQELYDLVWEQPMSTLAKSFGVSDVAIKKKCKKLKIPTPGLGSWAKIQVGKTVKRKPLPKIQGEAQAKYRFQKPTFRCEDFGPEDIEEMADELLADCGDGYKRVKVEEVLKNPHPLVAQTRTKLKECFAQWDGKTWPSGCLSVHVSRKNRVRALRILDALCKKAKACGFQIWPSQGHSDSKVTIDGSDVSFRLIETNKLAEEVWPIDPGVGITNRPLGAFNLFRFEIHSYVGEGTQKTWSDTKTGSLEDKLDHIFISLVRGAIFNKKRDERWERERLEEEVRRQKEEEARKARQVERERRKALLSGCKEFRQAAEIRELIASVEQIFGKGAKSKEDINRMKDWAGWASGVADDLDPLRKLSNGNLDLFEARIEDEVQERFPMSQPPWYS